MEHILSSVAKRLAFATIPSRRPALNDLLTSAFNSLSSIASGKDFKSIEAGGACCSGPYGSGACGSLDGCYAAYGFCYQGYDNCWCNTSCSPTTRCCDYLCNDFVYCYTRTLEPLYC
jgi:hypothetical protein